MKLIVFTIGSVICANFAMGMYLTAVGDAYGLVIVAAMCAATYTLSKVASMT